MKHFDSFLAKQLEDFLDYRLSLGYDYENQQCVLRQFDQYVKMTKPEPGPLSPNFFLTMRSSLKMEPMSVNGVICMARGFFDFMVRKGYYDENPVRDVPFLRTNVVAPFIFSPQQTDQLLTTLLTRMRKSPSFYMKDFTNYMVILLLARCGMRISEPLRLRIEHYRPEEKTLYIENTKFKKDRLIPIPMAVATEIDNYLQVRESLLGISQNPYLLPGFGSRRLHDGSVRLVFHRAVKAIDLARPRQVIGNTVFAKPTPHSLRHSFAVNTLKKIKQRGKSPQHALPVLAAYMGHVEYRSTAYYLKFLDAEQREGLACFVASHPKPS
jgi:site-specific recombinase XerD